MLFKSKRIWKIDFFKTQTSVNPISMNIFLTKKITVFLYNYKTTHATRHTKDLNKIFLNNIQVNEFYINFGMIQ